MDRGVRSSLLQTYWPSDNNRTYYSATVVFRLFGILRPTAFYRGLDERSTMIMVKPKVFRAFPSHSCAPEKT